MAKKGEELTDQLDNEVKILESVKSVDYVPEKDILLILLLLLQQIERSGRGLISIGFGEKYNQTRDRCEMVRF